MTATDSAQATQTTVVHAAERLGARSPAAVRTERRAWLILWVAFATFCALVFSAAKFTLEYVSSAQVDQSASITSSRGYVFVIAPGSSEKTVLARTEVGVGTVVALDRDSVSIAELQLFDQSRLKVLAGASIELSRMEVGRFIKQQRLLLNQTAGVVQYATVGPIDVELPNGGIAHLGPRSDSTIWIDQTGNLTRVLTYEGDVRLESSGQSVTVVSSKQARVLDGGFPRLDDRRDLLLPNGDFARQDEGWQRLDQPSNPLLDVNGQRFWVSGPDQADQKLVALRVLRENSHLEHGETGLVRNLNNLDVSGYRHLWLNAWVRVDFASLSGGGYLGSEYPMMLRMAYEGPKEGDEPGPWFVGFYVANPENRPAPAGQAERWPVGEWQKYSIDLMNTDLANLPYRLKEFSVMGQGHNYDARVAGIELIGE